jgi:hypothetical protein
MIRVEPVDPRVRLAIAQRPPDAPPGAVTTFCAEHSISRKTFYASRIFNVSYPMRRKDVYVVYEAAGLMIFDDRGTLIAEHNWRPPGIKCIGNGRPRGPKKKEVSPMS